MAYRCGNCGQWLQPDDRVVGVEYRQATPTQQDPSGSVWGGKRSLFHEAEWTGDTPTAREHRRGTVAELTGG
jgi:hypothetical protein